MAYQKLNTARAWEVIKNDSVDIPNISSGSLSGSASATTANKLVDATLNQFLVSSVQIGDIVVNTTDSTKATVTAVDSVSTLSLSAAYLQLVFVSFIGVLVFNETLHTNVVIGAVIVVSAGIFTLIRSRRATS